MVHVVEQILICIK